MAYSFHSLQLSLSNLYLFSSMCLRQSTLGRSPPCRANCSALARSLHMVLYSLLCFHAYSESSSSLSLASLTYRLGRNSRQLQVQNSSKNRFMPISSKALTGLRYCSMRSMQLSTRSLPSLLISWGVMGSLRQWSLPSGWRWRLMVKMILRMKRMVRNDSSSQNSRSFTFRKKAAPRPVQAWYLRIPKQRKLQLRLRRNCWKSSEATASDSPTRNSFSSSSKVSSSAICISLASSSSSWSTGSSEVSFLRLRQRVWKRVYFSHSEGKICAKQSLKPWWRWAGWRSAIQARTSSLKREAQRMRTWECMVLTVWRAGWASPWVARMRLKRSQKGKPKCYSQISFSQILEMLSRQLSSFFSPPASSSCLSIFRFLASFSRGSYNCRLWSSSRTSSQRSRSFSESWAGSCWAREWMAASCSSEIRNLTDSVSPWVRRFSICVSSSVAIRQVVLYSIARN